MLRHEILAARAGPPAPSRAASNHGHPLLLQPRAPGACLSPLRRRGPARAPARRGGPRRGPGRGEARRGARQEQGPKIDSLNQGNYSLIPLVERLSDKLGALLARPAGAGCVRLRFFGIYK